MRHAAIAERADQPATISPTMLLKQLLVDLLRRSPNLQFRQPIHKGVNAMLADVGSKLAVIFVAGDVGQAFVVEFVMVERRTGIVADVLLEHVASAGLGLVHGDEACDEGLGATYPFTAKNRAR